MNPPYATPVNPDPSTLQSPSLTSPPTDDQPSEPLDTFPQAVQSNPQAPTFPHSPINNLNGLIQSQLLSASDALTLQYVAQSNHLPPQLDERGHVQQDTFPQPTHQLYPFQPQVVMPPQYVQLPGQLNPGQLNPQQAQMQQAQMHQQQMPLMQMRQMQQQQMAHVAPFSYMPLHAGGFVHALPPQACPYVSDCQVPDFLCQLSKLCMDSLDCIVFEAGTPETGGKGRVHINDPVALSKALPK